MKQQVVDTNTGARDPNLLFEINNLSMNKVQVFPDGELDIQARNSAPNSAAFVRPTSAHRALQAHRPGSVTQQGPTRNAGAPRRRVQDTSTFNLKGMCADAAPVRDNSAFCQRHVYVTNVFTTCSMIMQEPRRRRWATPRNRWPARCTA